MAVHRNRVQVHSFVDGHFLHDVPGHEAHEMIETGAAEPIAWRKGRLSKVRLLRHRPYRPSTTITADESEKNAMFENGLRLSPRESIASFERAVQKIKVWPEVH